MQDVLFVENVISALAKVGNVALLKPDGLVFNLLGIFNMKRQWKKELPKPKNYFLLVGFVGLVTLCIYPSIIYPMLNPQYYKKIQEEVRRGINQEDVQPGDMRVWRDPFDRDKSKTEGQLVK